MLFGMALQEQVLLGSNINHIHSENKEILTLKLSFTYSLMLTTFCNFFQWTQLYGFLMKEIFVQMPWKCDLFNY